MNLFLCFVTLYTKIQLFIQNKCKFLHVIKHKLSIPQNVFYVKSVTRISDGRSIIKHFYKNTNWLHQANINNDDIIGIDFIFMKKTYKIRTKLKNITKFPPYSFNEMLTSDNPKIIYSVNWLLH